MNRQQSGFTLIELVIVIVLLGILAATAIPRFSSLTADARRADLQGMKAALQSAATIAHATQLAQGLASDQSVTLEGGVSVAMSNSYPTAAAGGINNALSDFSGFTFTSPRFDKDGGTSPNCAVTYTASVGGAFPVTSISSSGC